MYILKLIKLIRLNIILSLHPNLFKACPQNPGVIVGRRSEGHHVKCSFCCNDTRLCNLDVACHTASGETTTPGKDD